MHTENETHEHMHSHRHTHDGIHYHEHEHMHTHTHDGGHTHGEAGHAHTHDGEHSHEHMHGISPKDELIALIRYMADHNAAHTQEIVELSKRADVAGASAADKTIMHAAEHFKHGNELLAQALEMLK